MVIETLQVIENAASALANAFDNSGRAFSCGNGGSMCDSIHFAEELTGRFRKKSQRASGCGHKRSGIYNMCSQ